MSRANWNLTQEQALVDIYLEVSLSGVYNNGEHSRKPKAWTYITDYYNQKSGLKYNKDQLKNKWNSLKADYAIVKRLYSISGIGGSNGRVEASEEFWDDTNI